MVIVTVIVIFIVIIVVVMIIVIVIVIVIIVSGTCFWEPGAAGPAGTARRRAWTQHHAFLPLDHSFCQLARPAWPRVANNDNNNNNNNNNNSNA